MNPTITEAAEAFVHHLNIAESIIQSTGECYRASDALYPSGARRFFNRAATDNLESCNAFALTDGDTMIVVDFDKCDMKWFIK